MNAKDSYLDCGERSIRKDQPSIQQVEAACEDVPSTRCKATKNLLIYGLTDDRAFRASCKRWSCPVCARHNVRLCAWLIEAGLLDAFETDLRARYFVITSLPDKLSPSELQVRWNSFRTSFLRKGNFRSYATAIEVVDGRPHLNVVTVGGKFVHTSWLNRISSNAGLGGVWVTDIGKTENDAYRLSKYITKGARSAAAWSAEGGSSRVQPIRLSEEWKPCGNTEGRRRYFEERGFSLRKEQKFVRVSTSGGIHLIGRSHPSKRKRKEER